MDLFWLIFAILGKINLGFSGSKLFPSLTFANPVSQSRILFEESSPTQVCHCMIAYDPLHIYT